MKVGVHLNGFYLIGKRIVNRRTKEKISDKLITPLALYTPLQFLHYLGVEAIQFGVNGHISLMTSKMFKRYSEDFSLSFHSRYESPVYNLASPNPWIRRRSVKIVEKLAKMAEGMETFVVIHPGGGRKSFYRSRCTLEAFYESLKELRDKGLGRNISVESKPNDGLDYVLRTTPKGLDETETMLKLFPVNISLDVAYVMHGHENKEEANEYVREFIERFGSRINCVHCSEVRRGEGNHLGISDGKTDWLSIIKKLKTVGYDNDLIIEVKKLNQYMPSIKKLHSIVDYTCN